MPATTMGRPFTRMDWPTMVRSAPKRRRQSTWLNTACSSPLARSALESKNRPANGFTMPLSSLASQRPWRLGERGCVVNSMCDLSCHARRVKWCDHTRPVAGTR